MSSYGDKGIQIVYGEEKIFCTGPTRAAMADRNLLSPHSPEFLAVSRGHRPATPLYCLWVFHTSDVKTGWTKTAGRHVGFIKVKLFRRLGRRKYGFLERPGKSVGMPYRKEIESRKKKTEKEMQKTRERMLECHTGKQKSRKKTKKKMQKDRRRNHGENVLYLM
jgi:hypothetical protein